MHPAYTEEKAAAARMAAAGFSYQDIRRALHARFAIGPTASYHIARDAYDRANPPKVER